MHGWTNLGGDWFDFWGYRIVGMVVLEGKFWDWFAGCWLGLDLVKLGPVNVTTKYICIIVYTSIYEYSYCNDLIHIVFVY